MSKAYLNIGCGSKFHQDWINIDMVSSGHGVIKHDLRRGLPFEDCVFDVIYHSQVLEHFDRQGARRLMEECFRTLKPGGVLRVVVPDLENIAREYLRQLQVNLENPTPGSAADYDWMMLELLDQSVRIEPGGDMARFLATAPNPDFVIARAGRVAKDLITARSTTSLPAPWWLGKARLLRRIIQALRRKVFRSGEVGRFRLGGEVHLWMYDRFSLGRLFLSCGFEEIEVRSPLSSRIPDWAKYELDVSGGIAFDPTSLFMEGVKPGSSLF